ncbi:nucleoside phosphorylase [Sulfurospirillum cavolei]|uniref:nucleoside phosphorylase n=1 Tax=Sulfurospirillum cavolei TaxID=366522 RepID=UPI0005A7F3A8|nr:nucleoside phosphorylase [Sulfurospirillum cavolei]
MPIQTLIHTALVAEAKPIIGHFKLTCKAKQPFNLYENENVALIVSGMGSQNAKEALAYALSLYEPRVAINIGIAGCSDTVVAKGTLFCTTHEGLGIPFATCSSRQKAVDDALHVNTTLVDMEADTFLQCVPKTLENYVFKVVSDHLEASIPSKADVGNWIGKSIKQWEKYVRR